MVFYVEGNILDVTSGIICHQVNHKGIANAGLAKQIRNKYPNFMIDYLRVCKTTSYSEAVANGAVVFYDVNDKLSIASIFGQDAFGRDKQHTNYHSLKVGLETVREKAFKQGMSVYIPYEIGCGLAAGNWHIVERMIKELFGAAYRPRTFIVKIPS